MKFLKLLFLILIISCTKSNSNTNVDHYDHFNINPSDKNCENTFQFGKASLCIPKIAGMYNIIHNTTSKDYIQSKNFPGNTLVAYYVNKKIYKNLQVLWEDQFDDFFQIYVTNHNENKDVDTSYFTEVNEDYLKKYLNSDKWEALKERLENINEKNVFEKPVIIETYSLSKNSMQYVTFITIKKENTSKNMITIGNMFIVQNRLFFLVIINFIITSTQ
ncbi:hypothetical protein LF887_20460 [Chryseobacterium sp. MEBOG06]|uniref:hypothetical protein n=1 Tax=Chryseobacterium sp. MEBOG06 TaxID=2879938 RepID=UPI001F42B7F8|nr:hypothetical protein [Chryseobacterium sp. MEBOG06]UKB83359.1 hypothetical protein LF887_20460 [Chryseobacterium sp. MEBOG06]